MFATLRLAAAVSMAVLQFEIPDPPPHDAWPNPARDPRSTVELVLNALSRNHEPHADAGVETAYRFLTPFLQVGMGGLGGVKRALYQSRLRPLLDHRHVLIHARQTPSHHWASFRVDVLPRTGRACSSFRFELRVGADRTCPKCWLVAAIRPLPKAQTEVQSKTPWPARPGVRL